MGEHSGRRKNHAHAAGDHLESGYFTKAATGSGHAFPQADEAAFALQRQREGAFFAPKETLVEAAGGMKCFPGAEHESAAAEGDELRQDDSEKANKPDVKRDDLVLIEPRGSAAADGALVHRAECGSDSARIDDRVRVDKEEPVAASGVSAGIARGGDLAMVDGDNGRVVLTGDLGRGVSGSVIDDDDFIRLPYGGGIMNRLQRAAKARLLVVRRNDE